jgi:hypothetical protein
MSDKRPLDEQKLIAALPNELQEMIAEQFAMAQERQLAAIKADPVSHKKTTLFDGPVRCRYYAAGTDGRGREVRFCYTTTRNAAGYFLGFREVRSKTVVKRDGIVANRRKATVRDRARDLSEKFREASRQRGKGGDSTP